MTKHNVDYKTVQFIFNNQFLQHSAIVTFYKENNLCLFKIKCIKLLSCIQQEAL